jgi:hypothetical protein
MAKKTRSTLGPWADPYATSSPTPEQASDEALSSARAPAPADAPRRETYYLSGDVIEVVRDAAVHLGIPKGDVVETALRAWLATQQIPQRTRRVRRGRPVG